MHYDNDRPEAPFLPHRPCTDEELRAAVLSNLDETFDLIKPLPVQEVSMSKLQQIPFGVYRLEKHPPLPFWQESVGTTTVKPA